MKLAANQSPTTEWVRELYQRHESSLFKYAKGILRDPDRAADVVQDAFARLCREDPERLQQNARAWLFTVCRNRAFDILKKESRVETQRLNQLPVTSPEPDPAGAAQQRETAGMALSLLNDLPDNQQEAIRLRIEHGLSYREISDVLGTTVSNVGYLLHHGLKQIRTQLAQQA